MGVPENPRKCIIAKWVLKKHRKITTKNAKLCYYYYNYNYTYIGLIEKRLKKGKPRWVLQSEMMKFWVEDDNNMAGRMEEMSSVIKEIDTTIDFNISDC